SYGSGLQLAHSQRRRLAAPQHALTSRHGQRLARRISSRYVEGRRSDLPRSAGAGSWMGDADGSSGPGTRTALGGIKRIRGEVELSKINFDRGARLSASARREKMRYHSSPLILSVRRRASRPPADSADYVTFGHM